MRCGAKTIETRRWFTSYRGPLLICGAKRWTREQDDMLHIPAVQAALGGKWAADMLLGKAACLVDLFDCKRTEYCCASLAEQQFGNFGSDRYGWITRRLRTFEPFPVTGRQGLFEIEISEELLQGTG